MLRNERSQWPEYVVGTNRFFHRDFFAFGKEVSSCIWLRPEAALGKIKHIPILPGPCRLCWFVTEIGLLTATCSSGMHLVLSEQ
jgi:hypothetical protein